MSTVQDGILQPVPAQGRYLFFSLAEPVDPAALRPALQRLAALADGDAVVAGLGAATLAALGARVPGLREMPDLSGPGVPVPRTPTALWCWLRSRAAGVGAERAEDDEGRDLGGLVRLTRELSQALAPALRLDRAVNAFRHGRGPSGHGRDLTGYEDGTENPQDGAARDAALVQGAGDGLDGGSFVAVQQWLHDFAAFEGLSTTAQDHAIGRRRSDNEELDEAPASAHVKRTAQESFAPEAFVLRRSMPWAAGDGAGNVGGAGGDGAGLMFVAFGHSFDAFEAQMRRMAGLEDGIADALLGFSRPVSGAYFWCPPMRAGRLDLRQAGL